MKKNEVSAIIFVKRQAWATDGGEDYVFAGQSRCGVDEFSLAVKMSVSSHLLGQLGEENKDRRVVN